MPDARVKTMDRKQVKQKMCAGYTTNLLSHLPTTVRLPPAAMLSLFCWCLYTIWQLKHKISCFLTHSINFSTSNAMLLAIGLG